MERQGIGTRVRRARLSRQLTLEAASARVPCSVSHLNDIEHGRRRPSVDMIAGIARALEVSADYLLGLDQPAPGLSGGDAGEGLEDLEREFRDRFEEMIEDLRRAGNRRGQLLRPVPTGADKKSDGPPLPNVERFAAQGGLQRDPQAIRPGSHEDIHLRAAAERARKRAQEEGHDSGRS